MEEKLDFSLPQKKRKSSVANVVIILLLIIVIALALANLFIDFSSEGLVVETSKYTLTTENTRQLATRLAQRNLYNQAAKIWQDYLSSSKLKDAERAKVLFQIGTLLEKAEQYAEAIEYYYRGEIAAKLGELESEINAHIKNCFEKLGKFSALRYELIDRTSYEKAESAGGEVVAEIGPEKMTVDSKK